MSVSRPSISERPQEHDFDQRHDGPEEAAQVPLVSGPAHPKPSDQQEENIGGVQAKDRSKTSPAAFMNSPTSHTSDTTPVRHSTQLERTQEGRRSTQISRTDRRVSRDFDVRRDGPYGRPSLTMSRRKSSGLEMSPVGRTPSGTAARVTSRTEGQQSEEAVVDDQHTSPTSLDTRPTSEPVFEPDPPALNYTLRTRKLSIFIFWSLIVIDSTAMPIGLYFGLWYGTDLSPNIVFSIVTAALGGVSIIEYVLRFWRLWKHSSTCRVIGARRAYLDWFHWNFSFAWMIIMVELIVGTVPKYPPIRLLAMPLTSMLYAFGTEMLIVDIMRYFHFPAPVRISSIPKGSQLRPCVYSIIEDVCAVDGSGGTNFREDLNRRYEASHVFRAMLRRLGVFWAVGAEATAVLCTILIFTIQHEAAYVVGWTVPFIFAGIWTAGTFWYVGKMLKLEKRIWREEAEAKRDA